MRSGTGSSLRLIVDGRTLEAESGMTILQVAQQYGIYIPTFCDYPDLPPHGSCRLCVVEVQGYPNTPTACTTLIQEGMVIRTNSPLLQTLRTELLQLLLTEHPTSCLFCPENDNCDECMVTLRKVGVTVGCRSCPKDHQCDLQDMVKIIGLREIHYPIKYRGLRIEKEDPFFDRDYNLCVFCGRCIRICEHLHFAGTLTYKYRGSETLVGTAFDNSHLEAGCSFCGACVEVCPTGALTEKTRKWEGLPEQETISTCPFCSIGCQISLLSKKGTIIGSQSVDLPGSGNLCVKGRFGIPELVNHPDRLKMPQIAQDQKPKSISWDEAIQRAVERLSVCPPGQFEMLISASCSNEDLYIAQKFVRHVMGSHRIITPASQVYMNNLDAGVNLLGKSVSLDELKQADTILCIGVNTRYAQSVIEMELHQAKKRGANLITIHPEAHVLSPYADIWLKPTPGTGSSGRETELLRQLTQLVRSSPSTPRTGDGTGSTGGYSLSYKLIKAAYLLKESSHPVFVIGTEILDQPDYRQVLESIQNLVELTSARVISTPAQSNLLGAFLMGACPEILPGGEATVIQESSFSNGNPRVLYLVGEVLPSTGDPPVPTQPLVHNSGSPQLTNPEYVIYQNMFPPLKECKVDLILPTAAFTEEDSTSINHAGRLQKTKKSVPPPGEALPSWQILCRIARAMGAKGFDFATIEEIWSEIGDMVSNFQINEVVDRSLLCISFAGLSVKPSMASYLIDNDVTRWSLALNTHTNEHTYLGVPLTNWVDGLRTLYPDDETNTPDNRKPNA